MINLLRGECAGPWHPSTEYNVQHADTVQREELTENTRRQRSNQVDVEQLIPACSHATWSRSFRFMTINGCSTFQFESESKRKRSNYNDKKG